MCVWGGGGGGGEGRCEQRSEIFVIIKKKLWGVRFGGVRVGGGGGSQGECEQRIEVFVKIKKKIGGRGRSGGGGGGGGGGGRVGGVRVDVNEELKFL